VFTLLYRRATCLEYFKSSERRPSSDSALSIGRCWAKSRQNWGRQGQGRGLYLTGHLRCRATPPASFGSRGLSHGRGEAGSSLPPLPQPKQKVKSTPQAERGRAPGWQERYSTSLPTELHWRHLIADRFGPIREANWGKGRGEAGSSLPPLPLSNEDDLGPQLPLPGERLS
jgi:hypothetical protein